MGGAMTPERNLERRLTMALQARGIWAHHIDIIGCDGWPDILAMRDDHFLLIEVKAGTQKLRPAQSAFHAMLQVKHHCDNVVTVCAISDTFRVNHQTFRQTFDDFTECVSYLERFLAHGKPE